MGNVYVSYNGSSPRMWGTRLFPGLFQSLFRFIPTHVGNTHSLWLFGSRIPVHPHACGEHHHQNIFGQSDGGSSPRMWGTLHNYAPGYEEYRFIPTHVGNTKYLLIKSSGSSVHPHACGEHCPALPRSSSTCGSSPRMWGTRQYRHDPVPLDRFIPTHVGNTLTESKVGIGLPVHPHACGEHCSPDRWVG